MYDVLTSDMDIASAATEVTPHLSVISSEIDLAAAEIELVSTVGREQILRDRLLSGSLDRDFVMIDCPPSLGLLTLNALAAADEVLIPLQPHFLALQGLGKLLETVSLVQQRINPNLKVSGVVICMFDSNTRLANEVVADLREFFESTRDANLPWSKARIFKTPVRRNIKLAECPSYGKTIFQYEPSSNGATDYNALADEFLAVPELASPQPVVESANPAPAEIPHTMQSQPEMPATELSPQQIQQPTPIEPPAPATDQQPLQ